MGSVPRSSERAAVADDAGNVSAAVETGATAGNAAADYVADIAVGGGGNAAADTVAGTAIAAAAGNDAAAAVAVLWWATLAIALVTPVTSAAVVGSTPPAPLALTPASGFETSGHGVAAVGSIHSLV